MNTLLLLLVAHALADFPLQGDFLAQAKDPYVNRAQSLGGMPERIWPWCMGAHCLIHAGFVGILTANIWLGLAEFIAHGVTDIAKCRRRISFGQDQAIHIGCKAVWAALATL